MSNDYVNTGIESRDITSLMRRINALEWATLGCVVEVVDNPSGLLVTHSGNHIYIANTTYVYPSYSTVIMEYSPGTTPEPTGKIDLTYSPKIYSLGGIAYYDEYIYVDSLYGSPTTHAIVKYATNNSSASILTLNGLVNSPTFPTGVRWYLIGVGNDKIVIYNGDSTIKFFDLTGGDATDTISISGTPAYVIGEYIYAVYTQVITGVGNPDRIWLYKYDFNGNLVASRAIGYTQYLHDTDLLGCGDDGIIYLTRYDYNFTYHHISLSLGVPIDHDPSDLWGSSDFEEYFDKAFAVTGGYSYHCDSGYPNLVSEGIMMITVASHATYVTYENQVPFRVPTQTTWYGYSQYTKTSLGTPDHGVSIPEDNKLCTIYSGRGADYIGKHITQMRTAIEALAPHFKNAATGNPFNFIPSSSDNLYYKAMGDRTKYGATGGAKYTWTRLFDDMANTPLYDIDIGEIYECVALLESSEPEWVVD